MPKQDQLTPLQEQPFSTEPQVDLAQPQFSFWQIWNMNLGFLGIQFGWALQMANMSAIFEYLGADAHQIPILWIAAPLTGLLIQPIIGNLSDYTWGPLGRRRPYFLVGAIFASLALILMPFSSALWMAAGLLWLLDSFSNISMVPFRAFVGDLLPKEQRTWGFAMQSFMIGIGSVSASALPWILRHLFAINGATHPDRPIPLTVELSFYIGAAMFLGTVLWTVISTPEPPPADLEQLAQQKQGRSGIWGSLGEIRRSLQAMPPTMQQLAWVQFFTWMGIFCFFLYFPPAVAWNIFSAPSQESELYTDGIEWAGICFAVYNGACVGFSVFLARLTQRWSRQRVHGFCLGCGGLGLLSLITIHNPYLLLVAMLAVGIAWASILSLPYAMLVGAIPAKRQGIYMGIFNLFIVVPQILVSLSFGWVMEYWLGDNRLLAVVLGGGFLLIAAFLTQFIQLSPRPEGQTVPAPEVPPPAL